METEIFYKESRIEYNENSLQKINFKKSFLNYFNFLIPAFIEKKKIFIESRNI